MTLSSSSRPEPPQPFWRELFSVEGSMPRGRYVTLGVLLFFIKYNLDRVVSAAWAKPWRPSLYILPEPGRSFAELLPGERSYYLTLLAVALPFIWCGTALTIKRLRSIGWSPYWVLLFFLPVLNLFFFLILSLTPADEPVADARSGILQRYLPKDKWGSAAVGLLSAALLGVLLTAVSALWLQSYGWGLFVGMPFVAGFVSVIIFGYQEPRSLRSSLYVAEASILLCALILLGFAVEGFVCIIMAAPIGMALAAIGGVVGYQVQRRFSRSPDLLLCAPLILPLLFTVEAAWQDDPRVIAVTTPIDIAAPPEQVWPRVVSFSKLPEPTSWVFRSGIAYPQEARIEGEGVGALRYCTFSTGDFVEPIEVWDAPRLLRFSVTSSPPPMQEWSPYANINPAHLHGYFTSLGGQFLLEPLPDGGTRLSGTTWYRHRLWPGPYWRLFSDKLVHLIHERVLLHIKALAEGRAEE